MQALALLRRFAAATSLVAVAVLQPVWASTIVLEIPDAGDTTASALDIRYAAPTAYVRGSLSNEPATLDLVDMYRIDTNFVPFGARTIYDPAWLADPVLFLFDSLGVAVAMDDESGGNGQAIVSGLSGLAAGDYYLAIAFAGMEPLDANGSPMFDAFGTGGVTSTFALGSWGGSPFAIDPGVPGQYRMNVPEPGSLALISLALLSAAGWRRHGWRHA